MKISFRVTDIPSPASEGLYRSLVPFRKVYTTRELAYLRNERNGCWMGSHYMYVYCRKLVLVTAPARLKITVPDPSLNTESESSWFQQVTSESYKCTVSQYLPCIHNASHFRFVPGYLE